MRPGLGAVGAVLTSLGAGSDSGTYPDEGDVRLGTDYGPTGAEFTGELSSLVPGMTHSVSASTITHSITPG